MRRLWLFLVLVLGFLSTVSHAEEAKSSEEEEEDACSEETCNAMQKKIAELSKRLAALESQVAQGGGGKKSGGKKPGDVSDVDGRCMDTTTAPMYPVPELDEDFEDAPIRELLIGAGANFKKKIATKGQADWNFMVSIDSNPLHKPTYYWDLRDFPYPFPDDSFDEIHAYEVLEHQGQQGDYKFFFKQFAEMYRILKPNGLIVATVPVNNWIWGDPSHTRYIGRESLVFLDQAHYAQQIGKTPMSDFRDIYEADFALIWLHNEHTLSFALQAIKPSRFGMNEAQMDLAMEKLRMTASGVVQGLNQIYGASAEGSA